MADEHCFIERCSELNPGALKMDGHDRAVIGITMSQPHVLVYSYSKILENLVHQGMSEGEAVDFYSFNIQGSLPYNGANGPMVIDDE